MAYVTSKALRWALTEFASLPKNQTALLFFLILSKQNTVAAHERKAFEDEFARYFGGTLKGGGWQVFDPFAHEWRAAGYLGSTVYGRLFAGNHGWTTGPNRLFDRAPESGWPATIQATSRGIDQLRQRTSPPCLKQEYRLSLLATAIVYYRATPLATSLADDCRGVEKLYKDSVLSRLPELSQLFVAGQRPPFSILQDERPTDTELASCYPPAHYTGRATTRALLYSSDVSALEGLRNQGEHVADVVTRLLRERTR